MRRLLTLATLATLAGLLLVTPALAQTAEPTPEQLRTLAGLLQDPAIQSWLKAQADQPQPAAAGAPGQPAGAQAMMVSQLDAMRAFLRELAAAVPTLPDELGRAWATFAAERAAWGGQRPSS